MTFIYKAPITLLILTFLISSVFGTSSIAHAAQRQSCPLHSDVQVQIGTADEVTVSVEKTYTTEIVLKNQNPYFMPGVRVAVALFSPNDTATPLYWRVGGETQLLSPYGEVTLSLESNAEAIPAGEYVLKAFAFQGNETDLLGEVFRDAEKIEGISLKKISAATIEISQELFLDGNKIVKNIALPDRHTPSLRVETKNLSLAPILDAKLISMVSLGSIPLGGAVVGKAYDKTTLLPNFARINDFSTQPYELTASGIIVSTLVDDIRFMPIQSTVFTIENGGTDLSWPYISKIGFSAYPIVANSEIASCVSYAGDWGQLDYWPELLQGSLTITDKDTTLFSEAFFSDESSVNNYFSFTPEINLSTFDIKFSVSNHRLNTVIKEGTPEQMEAQMRSNLIVADEKKLSVVCADEPCGIDTLSIPKKESSENGDSFYQSFWFYIAVTLAATLLMYLLLRRLEPVSKEDFTKRNPDELQ